MGVFAGGSFLSEGGFGQRGIFAGGGFWPERGFCRRGFLARGGFWLDGGFCRRGVLAGGGFSSKRVGVCPEGFLFFPVPIDNNGGYTKY